ncbi:cytoplasmic dynein 2 intermediate chain 2-like isoform X1 [Athalia rosae]|uniref:cytoplasmic dynein 2 intermediate chain 2-like isoform X1 n=2 Tax=Athalia rosae TaxID=37344 RepID=UPI0020341221|nr:cytoplasmic dynein 2 intermediate chain 2-like isoform X1 [Athalia rosae]
MFNDQSSGPIGFSSQILEQRSQGTVSIQTEKVVCQELGCQLVQRNDAASQTVTQNKSMQHVDYDKLAEFLKRVSPLVMDELDEMHGSTALDDYQPSIGEVPSAGAKLLFKFNTLDETDLDKKISCISWSAAGGTLALSYSATYHDTWCDHVSRIKFYNITTENQSAPASSTTLQVNACVTTLAYHPTEPSILAAGLFNGDVLVCNLKEDKTSCPIQLGGHSDSLSVLQWHLKLLNSASTLVTASRDGYIFIHKFIANFTTVELHRRLKIGKEHNPMEKSRPRSVSGRRERADECGLSVTALDFSTKDPTTFVIGTSCGGLYQCSIDHDAPIEGTIDTFDPVVNDYERHQGSITSVMFTALGDRFVTSATDKEIRIYNVMQFISWHTILVEDTSIGLSWVPGNQEIIAAFGAGQTITFYNLETCKSVTNSLLDNSSKDTSCLKFNTKRDLLAIGDTYGSLGVWKLSRNALR